MWTVLFCFMATCLVVKVLGMPPSGNLLSQQHTLSHHSPDGWEAALACSNASGHAVVVCDLLRRVVKPDVGIRVAETKAIRRCKLYCSVEQLPAVNGIHCWLGQHRTVDTRQSKAQQITTCIYVCDALGSTTMEAIRYVTGARVRTWSVHCNQGCHAAVEGLCEE